MSNIDKISNNNKLDHKLIRDIFSYNCDKISIKTESTGFSLYYYVRAPYLTRRVINDLYNNGFDLRQVEPVPYMITEAIEILLMRIPIPKEKRSLMCGTLFRSNGVNKPIGVISI